MPSHKRKERGKQRSIDATRFAMVPRNDVPRSAFSVPHSHKTTFRGAHLVPVYVDEVLPGDSVKLKMTAFARLATPIVPVMDNLTLESFFFYVPNRLVWEHWERFMGQQDDPADTTEFLVPQYEAFGVDDEHIANYMGINNQNSGLGIDVSALPFRAYNLIWNEWFRDQDLQDPVPVDRTDGPDTTAFAVLKRGKRHDYFTSARPWPQKPMNVSEFSGQFVPGQAMTLPQAGAPVSGIGFDGVSTIGPAFQLNETGARSNVSYPREISGADITIRGAPISTGFPDVRVLINDIRTANAVQVLLERNARGGTRYTEIIRSHFGVVSPDARLQRPEYLGGGRTFVSVNPVAQTSASGATGSTTVLGELAAVGTALATGHGFSSSFTEHGIILGLVCVRPDLSYQQGVRRMWFRRSQFDFYWPALAHLGEQAIMSREIYADGTANDGGVFGYQERWSEYKYHPSRVSGLFRSRDPLTLDMWHFSQLFLTRPVLNDVFIEETDVAISRVLQIDQFEGTQFLFDSMFDVRMVRCMPMFSIPGLGPRL